MPKKTITIQLPPMLISKIWQFGKDEGYPKQVAIERLIEYGFNWIEERGYKSKEDHNETSKKSKPQKEERR